jgi:hypothetical protein
MQLTWDLHHASYLKLLRIRDSANPFNPMKLFTHSQKPRSSFASIPEFVVGSHPAYWNPALVGGVWLKLAADDPHVPVAGTEGGSNGLHIRGHHRRRRLSLTATLLLKLQYSNTKSSDFLYT